MTGEVISNFVTPKHIVSCGVGLLCPVVFANLLSANLRLLKFSHNESLKMIYAASFACSALVFRNWEVFYDSKGNVPLEARYRYLGMSHWAYLFYVEIAFNDMILGSLGPLLVGQWAAGMFRLSMLNKELTRHRWADFVQLVLDRDMDLMEMMRLYLRTSIWQLSFGFLSYVLWIISFDLI